MLKKLFTPRLRSTSSKGVYKYSSSTVRVRSNRCVYETITTPDDQKRFGAPLINVICQYKVERVYHEDTVRWSDQATWIENNLKSIWYYGDGQFRFYLEEDALAFKLVWS